MDNINAALRLAVLGLSITFIALFVLRIIIGMLARFTSQPTHDNNLPQAPHHNAGGRATGATTTAPAGDEEVAAIMAVLSAMGATPKPGGRIRIEEIPS